MLVNIEIASCYQELFNHLSAEHNLIITISEMDDIIKHSLKTASCLNLVFVLHRPTVVGSVSFEKPLIDRCKYELRRYTELAKRMDELINEYNMNAKYNDAKEAEIKRNCYNRVVNDLKMLCQ